MISVWISFSVGDTKYLCMYHTLEQKHNSFFQVTWQLLRFRRCYFNSNVNFPYFIVLESFTCLNEWRHFHCLLFFYSNNRYFCFKWKQICRVQIPGYRGICAGCFGNKFYKSITDWFTFYIYWKWRFQSIKNLIKWSFIFLFHLITASI